MNLVAERGSGTATGMITAFVALLSCFVFLFPVVIFLIILTGLNRIPLLTAHPHESHFRAITQYAVRQWSFTGSQWSDAGQQWMDEKIDQSVTLKPLWPIWQKQS